MIDRHLVRYVDFASYNGIVRSAKHRGKRGSLHEARFRLARLSHSEMGRQSRDRLHFRPAIILARFNDRLSFATLFRHRMPIGRSRTYGSRNILLVRIDHR